MELTIINDIKQYCHQISMIKTTEILFSEQVRMACSQNHCGCWGKTWTCPPGCGSVSELQAIVMQYENMLIMTNVVKLEDSFDLEGMNSGRKQFSEYLHQLNKKYQITTRKMMIFGVGSCEFCQQCTYPEAECRHPLEKFIALEAAGIDVVSLAQTANIKYYNGKNTVTYFAAILYHEDR
ncbi:MAG: DUF2284 domain-containing protein [Bacilli bacterium]|jgi:predicted metal-binding protein|nr:DUF2284 domain-containing protein [Bacilli bacterium]MDY0209492.1 DUF2284 domain-containing protein [Bacilli bacterium]